MSDNKTRYREIQTSLEKFYPTQPKGNFARNLNTLAAMISGIVGSKNTQLPKIVYEYKGYFNLSENLS